MSEPTSSRDEVNNLDLACKLARLAHRRDPLDRHAGPLQLAERLIAQVVERERSQVQVELGCAPLTRRNIT